MTEREHLDLLKLMQAEDAARVAAGSASLATEARREPGIAERQLIGDEDLVGVECGERHLAGTNEKEIVVFEAIDALAIGREEARREHRLLAHQDRRHNRSKATLAELVESHSRNRPPEACNVAGQVAEARARRAGTALHVDAAARQLEVVKRLKIEGRNLADNTQLARVLIRIAKRRIGVGEVWHDQQRSVELLINSLERLLETIERVLQRTHLGRDRIGLLCSSRIVLGRALQLPNRLGRTIALGAELVDLHLQRAALRIERQHRIQQRRIATTRQRLADHVGIAADEAEINHRGRLTGVVR